MAMKLAANRIAERQLRDRQARRAHSKTVDRRSNLEVTKDNSYESIHAPKQCAEIVMIGFLKCAFTMIFGRDQRGSCYTKIM